MPSRAEEVPGPSGLLIRSTRLLEELDDLTIVQLEVNSQGITGRNFDLLDGAADNCFDLEPKVGSPERSQLNQGIAELFASGLGNRGDLCNVEAVNGALISQVNDALGYEIVGVRWDGQIADDLARKEVALSSTQLARINEWADDQSPVKGHIRCGFPFGKFAGYSCSLKLPYPLVPLFVELAIVRGDHCQAETSRDSK
jgi:hypothetical protein